MNRLLVWFPVAAMLLGAGGCDCGGSGNSKLPTAPSIAIVEPSAGANIPRSDDLDSNASNGIQVAARVSSESLGPNARITLSATNGDTAQDSSASAITDEAGDAKFDSIDLPPGNVTLTASATNRSSGEEVTDQVSLTVFGFAAPTIAFTAPLANARLTAEDDTDHDPDDTDGTHLLNGFTVNVSVATENVEDGNAIRLFVGNQQVALGSASNGTASFDEVPLDEAPEAPGLELRVETANSDGDAAQATINVQVDTGRCVIVVRPLPVGGGACDVVAGGDGDPGDGILPEDCEGSDDADCTVEVDFTIQSNCGSVDLSLNGTSLGEKQVEGEDVAYDSVALTQADVSGGANEIIVSASSTDGRTGETAPLSFTADTIAPAPTFNGTDGVPSLVAGDDPADNLLLARDDRDQDTDGLQMNLHGTACGQAAGDEVTVTLTDGDGDTVAEEVAAVELELGDDGCNLWTIDDYTFASPGTFTLTVSATDACGNAGAAAAAITADFILPELTITSPADGTVLQAADDEDEDADGFQLTVTVRACDMPTGPSLQVETSPDGEPPWIDAYDALGEVMESEDRCQDVDVAVSLASGAQWIRAHFEGPNDVASEPGTRVTPTLTTPTIAFSNVSDGDRVGGGARQIIVATTNTEANQLVTLTLNGDALDDTAAVQDNGARFRGVILQEGSNTLQADVQDIAAQAATTGEITVTQDSTAPTVAFASPAEGAELTAADDDNNELADGFQVDIVLDVVDADPGTNVCVRVGGGAPTCQPKGDGGQVTFDVVQLFPGANNLSATATDLVGNLGIGAAAVNVDIPAPRIEITAPADGSCLGSSDDVAVAVESEAGDGRVVTLTIGGGQAGQAALVGTTANFTVDLQEGESTLGATVPGDAGVPGTAPPARVTVKTSNPTLNLQSPADAAVVNADTDAWPDSSGAAGFQTDVVVDAALTSPLQGATLTLDCGAGPAEYEATISDGSFTFEDVTLPAEAACDVDIDTTDCAGNSAHRDAAWTVDRVRPAASFQNPVQGETVGFQQDVNPDLEGVQANVICTVTGVAEGDDVCLSMDGGAPNCVATSDGTGRASFAALTLPEGEGVSLACSGTDPAGNPGSGQITVTVISGEPLLLWLTPNGGTDAWNVANDSEGDAGFQGDFRVRADSIPDGTPARLCSDLHGDQGDFCGRQGFRTLATTNIQGVQLVFNGITVLEGQHRFYVETTSGVDDEPESDIISLSVDGSRPTITSITVTSDDNEDEILNAAEDTDGAAGVQATFTVVTGGGAGVVEDGRVLSLVTDNPAPGTVLASGAVNAGSVSLSATLAEGLHQEISARVTDAAGNAALAPPDNPAVTLTVDSIAPTVSIADPNDGATLLAADDVDGNAGTGLQYTARVVVGAATRLVVEVNDVAQGAPVDDPVGAVDHAVTFPEGPGQRLGATVNDDAGNSTSIEITVTAAPRQPTLAITAPDEAHEYDEGDDVDGPRGGFQVDIAVTTTELAPGRLVEIRSASAGLVSDAAVVGGDGTLTARCSLPPGAHSLTAHGADTHGNQGVSAAVNVTVTVAGCGLAFTAPAGNPVFVNIANDDDGNPGSGGQLDVRATSLGCEGETANLLGAGDPIPVLIADGAAVWDDVTLAEGQHSLQVRVSPEGEEDSFSEVKTVNVDLTAPTVAFSAPVDDPALLGVADDLDPGTAGVQLDFVFDVTGTDGGSLSIENAGGEIARTDDLAAGAQQTLFGVGIADGAHTLTARVTDAAGNPASAQIAATADSVAPAAPGAFAVELTDGRRPTARLTWNAPGDNGNGGGQVTGYKVRYSTAAITDGNFDAACDPSVAVVVVDPGSPQQVDVSGPGPDGACRFRTGKSAFDIDDVDISQDYHWAVRAVDDLGNDSPVATDAPTTTGYQAHSFPAPNGYTAWGQVLAELGDVNDDGFADVGVGSWSDGLAHIIYGAADPGAADVHEIGSGGFTGYNFAGVGDVNADGIDDLVMGDACTASVFLGRAAPRIDETPVATFAADDGTCAIFFDYVSPAGNFNGDESGGVPLADFVLGAPRTNGSVGAGYIVLGRTVWPAGTVDLTADAAANGVVTFSGDKAAGRLGSTAAVGDGDGDGLDDIVLGAANAEAFDGTAYLVRGRAVGNPAPSLTPASARVTTFDTRLTLSRFGASLAGGVDLCGDESPDFSVGTAVSETIYVFDGSTEQECEVVTSALNHFGFPNYTFSDLNEDGLVDLIAATETSGSGTAAIALGGNGAFSALDPVITGANTFGKAVAAPDRFTGPQGKPAILIGSPGSNELFLLY